MGLYTLKKSDHSFNRCNTLHQNRIFLKTTLYSIHDTPKPDTHAHNIDNNKFKLKQKQNETTQPRGVHNEMNV